MDSKTNETTNETTVISGWKKFDSGAFAYDPTPLPRAQVMVMPDGCPTILDIAGKEVIVSRGKLTEEIFADAMASSRSLPPGSVTLIVSPDYQGIGMDIAMRGREIRTWQVESFPDRFLSFTVHLEVRPNWPSGWMLIP